MGKIFRSLQFWVSLSLILGGLLTVVSLKLFWGAPPHWRGASKQLQLSEEQRLQLSEIRKNSRMEHHSLGLEIQSKEAEFRKTIADGSKSAEDLEKLFVELDRSRSSMGRLRFEMTLKIREIIGAEKMNEFRRSHRPSKRGKRGRRGRGHLSSPGLEPGAEH